MTKDEIRSKIRMRLKFAGVERFPGFDSQIPNFEGAERAAMLLCELPMWKRARVVKINNDAPQLALRRAALRDGKILYLSVPRLLSERCFIELDPERLGSRIIQAGNVRAAMRLGRPHSPSEVRPIDLVVCGALAVTRQGARLGHGGGYSDIEYALLRGEGKVREYTPILTTIHPLQLIEDRLPMRGHDIPVDFVVMPEQIITAPSLHPRPRGLVWDILREDKIRAIPLLRKRSTDPRNSPVPRHI